MKMLALILTVTAAGLLASANKVKELEKERIAALRNYLKSHLEPGRPLGFS